MLYITTVYTCCTVQALYSTSGPKLGCRGVWIGEDMNEGWDMHGFSICDNSVVSCRERLALLLRPLLGIMEPWIRPCARCRIQPKIAEFFG